MKTIEQVHNRFGSLFFYMASFSMLVVIAVASCTSRETFVEIYRWVSEFLSLSNTSLSMTLRDSPSLGHFLSYSLLGFSLGGVFSRRLIFFAPLVAVLFGVLMEIVQIFIPSRDADLMDIAVNTLGVALGFGIYFAWVAYGGDKSKPD